VNCREWPPPRRPYKLYVAIPGSILGTEPSLLLKTLKSGIIARILAMHRVDSIILFRDPVTSRKELRLLAYLLKYAVTPPHLKKKVFGLSRVLRYAGVIMPLNLVNHDPPSKLNVGDLIDGYVESCNEDRCIVYLGRAGYGIAPGGLRVGSITTFRVTKIKGGSLELRPSSWGNIYTGYRVSIRSNLIKLIEDLRKNDFRIVATSVYGKCVDRITMDGNLLLIFGGPRLGLLEYTDNSLYDEVINTVPLQGVKTVRTEEALNATLAKLA